VSRECTLGDSRLEPNSIIFVADGIYSHPCTVVIHTAEHNVDGSADSSLEDSVGDVFVALLGGDIEVIGFNGDFRVDG